MKLLLTTGLLFALAISAAAAESHEVSYRSGDETVHALLYTPAGEGPFPALVVIHEWWGLNDWVKQQPSSGPPGWEQDRPCGRRRSIGPRSGCRG